MEFKKDRAEQCARALASLDEADWKELVIGLLRSYVDFRQIPKDAEDEEWYRAPMLEWYALLTEGATRLVQSGVDFYKFNGSSDSSLR